MIRPLRRRHQWIVRALFALLVVAAIVAFTHPAPDARTTDLLPALLRDGGATKSR